MYKAGEKSYISLENQLNYNENRSYVRFWHLVPCRHGFSIEVIF